MRLLPAIQRINNSLGSCLPAFFLFPQCLQFPAKIVYGHNSTYVGWLLMPKYTWKVIEIHTVKCKYNVFNTFVDIAQCLMIFFLCFSKCFRWTQQLSPRLWFLFLFLYLCEILVLVIYLREWESHWKVSRNLMYFTLIPVGVGESNSILGILASLCHRWNKTSG